VTDVREMVSQQRRIAEKLRAVSDGPAMLDVVRELASTLRAVVADEDLWCNLMGVSALTTDKAQLAQLALLDWSTLLEEAGYGEDETLVNELIAALDNAGGSVDPEVWGEVRVLLEQLADKLDADADAPKPAEDKRWWRALRNRAAHGVSALRRVSAAALLTEVFERGAGLGVQVSVLLISGTPFVFPALLATVVGGLAIATVAELRRGWAEEKQERIAQGVDKLLGGAFAYGAIGNLAPDLMVLEAIGTDQTIAWGGELPQSVIELLAKLRRWSARAGAELASGWSFVDSHFGPSGAQAVDVLTERLAIMRPALSALAEALITGVADLVARAVASMRAAITAVEDAVRELKLRLRHEPLTLEF
jgi:hypothetical protein